MRLLFFLLSLSVIGFFFLPIGEAGEICITLRESAVVQDDYIRLPEIAVIAADADVVEAADRLFLGPSPQGQATRILTREEIRVRMQEMGLSSYRLEGAEKVVIRRKAKDAELSQGELSRPMVWATPQQIEEWLMNAIRARLEAQYGRRDLRVTVRVRSIEGKLPSTAGGMAITAILSGALPGQAKIEAAPLPSSSAIAQTEKIKAQVEVDVSASVLVLTRSLMKGERISSEDLSIEERPLRAGTSLPRVSREDVVGRMAVRPLSAKTPLSSSDVALPFLVEKSRPVVVDTQGDGFRIQTHAIALADGRLGDLVMVEGIGSKAKFLARVTGPGSVEYAQVGREP